MLVLKNRGFVELYQVPPPGTTRQTQQQEQAETAAAPRGGGGGAAAATATAAAAGVPGPGPSQAAAAGGVSADVWVALTQTGVEVASQRQMPEFVLATQ